MPTDRSVPPALPPVYTLSVDYESLRAIDIVVTARVTEEVSFIVRTKQAIIDGGWRFLDVSVPVDEPIGWYLDPNTYAFALRRQLAPQQRLYIGVVFDKEVDDIFDFLVSVAPWGKEGVVWGVTDPWKHLRGGASVIARVAVAPVDGIDHGCGRQNSAMQRATHRRHVRAVLQLFRGGSRPLIAQSRSYGTALQAAR
jgi:hypothetical protein